jgi:hypothetical protein
MHVISRFLPLQVVLVLLGVAAVRRDFRRYRAASGGTPEGRQLRRVGHERVLYGLVFVICFVLAVSSRPVWGWPKWIGYSLGALAAVALIGGRWRTLRLEASASSDKQVRGRND